MDLKDVIKNINDAKEQLQKSVDVEKSEQDDEQQEEDDKSVEPKTKEEAGGKAPVEKSEVEDKEAPEDDSEDHEDHEDHDDDDEESSEDDAEKACNVEDDNAEKSCGDKKVAKSDDSEDGGSDIDKSVFMQHLEMFENLSKSYIDLANSSIELAQSVLAKSINDTDNQEVVEKSVEPESEDEADSETQTEETEVEKSVAPEADSEVPAEEDNVEKSTEPEPGDEADDVEKSMPKGKSLQYADDAPEDSGIEKSVKDEPVKVSELKDAVAKSIRGLQGYTLMAREQGALKSLLHKVDELNPEDVAPKELVDAYNKI